jgi:acyl-CoA synthetase (AMP-forming)/AMP-acid ligase II
LILCEGRTLAYAEFAREVHGVANALLRRGVQKGDKIALLLSNRPEFLFVVFAASEIGAVFVPVNTSFTAEEAQYVVHHSESSLLITEQRFLPLVKEIRGQCPLLRQVISLKKHNESEVIAWEEFLHGAATEPPVVSVRSDELASITYTSGTTDRPKGVLLSQYAYAFAPAQRAAALGWKDTDRVYVLMPLFHVNALCHMVIAMMSVGGSVVLRDKFSASQFWDEVRAYGVTTSSIMRTIPNILMNLPEKADDAQNPLRQVVALLAPEQHVYFEQRFGLIAVPSYSLTEDILSVIGSLDKTKRKLGSCGLPTAPEVHKLRIVKDTGEECGPGELGEIVKQSPTVMQGYFKNPKATAEALRDGWLYTGDLGYLDEEGFLYFVDRKKDMIKRADENVSAEEVERVLNSHPLVVESAVVGVADPIRQEEIKAFIVLKPPATPETLPAKELWDFCAKHLAPFKIPRYIEYRTVLPKTPTEKIQKGALRAEAQSPSAAVFDRARSEE